MFYKLYLSTQEELKSLPESGMGYQLIEANFCGEYTTRKLIVLNEELIVEDNYMRKDYLRQIFSKGFKRSVQLAEYKSVKNIRLISKEERSLNVLKEGSSKSSGAKDSPLINPDGKTYHVRLSAYDDDKRIDKKNNCLLPGSYTTTKKDYEKCVNEKDDPVERYALPNDEKVEWAFHILPVSKDVYRFGTVQPAFGKRGGGEECFFENGTSFGTFKEQTKYGVFYP